jgi:hypothetical protein
MQLSTLQRPPAAPNPLSRIFTTYAAVCDRLNGWLAETAARLLSPKRLCAGDELMYGSKEHRFYFGGGR